MVHGLQEAAEHGRKLFQKIANTLKEKLEVAKSILADEHERMVMIQEEEQNFREMIESEYRIRFRLMIEDEMKFRSLPGAVSNLTPREASLSQPSTCAAELKEKAQETLQKLKDLARENMNKLKESEVRLADQVCSLHKTIAELEKKCGQHPSTLLENARSSLERSEALLLQCLEPARITDLSACQIAGMSEVLKGLQRPLTLDPNTAHPCLVLAEDLRSVRLRKVQQAVPGNPGRFDFSATVLAAESFTSGRHYWEVDVDKAAKWQLGVCRDGDVAHACGQKVLLMGCMMGTDYTLWAFPPLQRVHSRKQMHHVGVFVDYECGQIAFYDVTKGALIYIFSYLSFQGALRPVFSLCIPSGGTDSDSLSLCLPPVSSCNVTTIGPQSSLG
ncbi:probable E3 ubiquitin-protein ligase TRIML2 [Manis pentadactyla]|uniref:probable E3 ubiquitin-protein ligase TRIML2 n=1 Tax=Manis pentadactyla TaxID=143292 RepID=UPI00255CC948|nr:probable E3 ubiquitin-protein ligase TRIML2 [Manis pentadactyla]